MCALRVNKVFYDKKNVYFPLQDALIKRLGEGAHPFTMNVAPQAPPSVQLVPAKRYYGAPIGTSYDIRCYVGESPQLIISSQYTRDNYDDAHQLTAERSDEKLHRRSTVRMGIRLIHKNDDDNNTQVQAPDNLASNNQQQNSQQPVTSPPCSSTTLTTAQSAQNSPLPTPLPQLPLNVRGSKTERGESFSKMKLSPKAFRFTGKLCRSKSEIEKRSADFYNVGNEVIFYYSHIHLNHIISIIRKSHQF